MSNETMSQTMGKIVSKDWWDSAREKPSDGFNRLIDQAGRDIHGGPSLFLTVRYDPDVGKVRLALEAGRDQSGEA
jgi:hypothetical protein